MSTDRHPSPASPPAPVRWTTLRELRREAAGAPPVARGESGRPRLVLRTVRV
jgi:hypothetical protein